MTRPRCSLGPTQRQIQLALRHMAPADSPLRQQPLPKERKPRAKKNKRIEDSFQITCCDLLDTLPNTDYFSVPNHLYLGRSHSDGEKWAKVNYIRKQKRMGMKNGIFDLVITFISIHGIGQNVGCECKIDGTRENDKQSEEAVKYTKYGWVCGVIRTLDDLTSLLKMAGHPSFQH